MRGKVIEVALLLEQSCTQLGNKRNTRLESLLLAGTEVDIWRVDLAEHQAEIQQFPKLLSPDETQRADRFCFERDRRRFIVARTATRQILSQYVNLAPKELVFSYGKQGKPELEGDAKKSGITFNVSHCCETALIAVTRGLIVGIDIEQINPEFATKEISQHFFSVSEVARLRTLPQSAQAKAFFSCWTRKEAYVKALGEGLSVPLNSFEVFFGPEVPAGLIRVRVGPDKLLCLSIYDIDVSPEFKAALVIEGNGHQLRQMIWIPQGQARIDDFNQKT